MDRRVQMIDSRLWEEDGDLVPLGPDELEREWLAFAAAYTVEHVADDVRGAEGYSHVVALFPDDERVPALYFLITAQTATKLADGDRAGTTDGHEPRPPARAR